MRRRPRISELQSFRLSGWLSRNGVSSATQVGSRGGGLWWHVLRHIDPSGNDCGGSCLIPTSQTVQARPLLQKMTRNIQNLLWFLEMEVMFKFGCYYQNLAGRRSVSAVLYSTKGAAAECQIRYPLPPSQSLKTCYPMSPLTKAAPLNCMSDDEKASKFENASPAQRNRHTTRRPALE